MDVDPQFISSSSVIHAGQNYNIQIGSKSFETVEQFRYLVTTQTNQNSIPEEIKNRLKLGNSCYHSVQNLFVFQFGFQKYIDEDIQNCNFTLSGVGVRLGLLH
jgi:hypothetical protein